MLSRVNLVAILLTLYCVIRAIECSRSPREQDEWQRMNEERNVAAGEEAMILRYNAHSGNVTSTDESPLPSASNGRIAIDNLTEEQVEDDDDDDHSAHSEIDVEERDRPRNRKKRMDRTMLALLMAYKLKFVALIPTLLGGLILLKGTTLLAGFFFALFAAVLGLKVH